MGQPWVAILCRNGCLSTEKKLSSYKLFNDPLTVQGAHDSVVALVNLGELLREIIIASFRQISFQSRRLPGVRILSDAEHRRRCGGCAWPVSKFRQPAFMIVVLTSMTPVPACTSPNHLQMRRYVALETGYALQQSRCAAWEGKSKLGRAGGDGGSKRGRSKYVNETSSLKIGAEGEARVAQRGPKPHLLRSPLPRVFIPTLKKATADELTVLPVALVLAIIVVVNHDGRCGFAHTPIHQPSRQPTLCLPDWRP